MLSKHSTRTKQSLLPPIVAIFAIGLVYTAKIAIAQPIDSSSRVTLGIFSGRRDPTWSLSAADTNRIIAQIQQLKSIPTHRFMQKLGIERWSVALGSTPDFILVERGFIEYRQQGKSRFFQDPNFTIERQLLQSGKDTLTPTNEHYHLIRSFKIPNRK